MKIKVTVKAVNVIDFDEDGNTTLRIKCAEKFQGIKRQEDGTYTQCDDCDTININLRAATAMLCAVNDDIAVYRSCQPRALTQRQLALILIDAKLEIERQFIAAGEVLPKTSDDTEDYVAEYDMFSTNIIAVTLSTKAQRRLDEALAL